MKFSELAYNRPDIAKICENLSALTEKMIAAPDAKTQIELINEKEQLLSDFGTNATIASIRHTIDTRDAFYEAENNFFDENGPVLEEKAQDFMNAVLDSKFRGELEEKFGKLLFVKLCVIINGFCMLCLVNENEPCLLAKLLCNSYRAIGWYKFIIFSVEYEKGQMRFFCLLGT